MKLRPLFRAAAILCLMAQALVAVAPAGVEVCLRAVAERFAAEETPAAVVGTCCACCCEDEAPAETASLAVDECPPGCDCCMSVPQTDQLPGGSGWGGGGGCASLMLTHLLPATPALDLGIPFTADARLVGHAVCERPPPELAAWCHSIRLLI